MDDTKITGYGPNVTEARVAEIRRSFAVWGTQLEWFALAAPEGAVVLHGRSVWMEVLREAGLRLICVETFASPERPCSSIAMADGAELAALLTRLGRESDAAKVTGGPPDQPRPAGARLLVCLVDEDCVAVTWSAGTAAFGARRFS